MRKEGMKCSSARVKPPTTFHDMHLVRLALEVSQIPHSKMTSMRNLAPPQPNDKLVAFIVESQHSLDSDRGSLSSRE